MARPPPRSKPSTSPCPPADRSAQAAVTALSPTRLAHSPFSPFTRTPSLSGPAKLSRDPSLAHAAPSARNVPLPLRAAGTPTYSSRRSSPVSSSPEPSQIPRRWVLLCVAHKSTIRTRVTSTRVLDSQCAVAAPPPSDPGFSGWQLPQRRRRQRQRAVPAAAWLRRPSAWFLVKLGRHQARPGISQSVSRGAAP